MEQNDNTNQAPAPEALKPRADDGQPLPEPQATTGPPTGKDGKPLKRRTYRPSHKATFIGLAVVVFILAVNAVVLTFLIKKQNKLDNLANNGQVTISSDVLNKLGVNNSTVGSSGVLLVVGPDAQFKGKVSIAGDTTLSGQLKLNGKVSASDASLTQLEAGNASLSKLNVNSDSTLSNLNLRGTLVVTSTTQMQGAVTINQLLSVNNNVNILGNVAVGGTLSVKSFSANSLVSVTTLTIGGHIITGGSSPSVAAGSALGSNGTVSISGNDSAGIIDINIGAPSGGNGTLARVAFKTNYGNVPRVVITPVGTPGTFYITSLTTSGFTVAVGSSLSPGGYAVNYIVEQ